ncbi:single-stranded-DNA-specific exonuclease RecJ [Adlercreutzia sp. ZJ154]|uniref:single-stranded-DNA-specific exonuclease RecJ n=1 Tax=Adlercreutzia sp. ZJ154 TaxID=2709790 RepID=UPI0013E9EAC8|nr:single-stranded-DNA-specific exonuclease RecJ [Adlercreutzia sp. ZJ154]
MSTQFKVSAAAPDAVACLQRELNMPHFLAATLVARGFDTPFAARSFMSPSLERDWLNPYDLPGMADVANSVEQAIDAHKHIVVFGDFDLDGISATTVLTRGIRALGGKATPFIPKRFEEGYGLSLAAYERMKQLQPDLIVTVDCGIACAKEVAAIIADGVSVAVTDHHEAGSSVPVGIPVCDPKIVDGCPSNILAGVGVALKLVQMLGSRRGFPYLWRSYTDFAALGTVADLMPMRDENRALVADGLAHMNNEVRPCIAALIEASGSSGKPITSTSLSFTLVPRLNAAGRMGDAQLALDLLMCDSYPEAFELAQRLEQVNDERRAIEAQLSEVAKAQASEIYAGQRILVVAGAGWHEGVKGIVASRLVGMYGVPAILFTIDGDEARGSGRSVGNVNLFAAIENVEDLLTRFGGHEAAVGVTLPAKNLPEFTRRLQEYMQMLPESEFKPITEVDAIVSLDELTLQSVQMMDALAPFGQENPVPHFLARNVTLENCRAVGADKNHFSCNLTNGRTSIGAILFHCENIQDLLHNDSVVDAAFSVQIDEWRGRRSVKAMLDTLAPAHVCGALCACIDPSVPELFEKLFGQESKLISAALTCAAAPSANSEQRTWKVVSKRAAWEELGKRDPKALEAQIIEAIIGKRTLHPAQRKILDRLTEGKSTLGVMATGRGKSLIFQVYAAMQALVCHKASLFVYPLRALMADQAFHMAQQFSSFGLNCAVLNGECSQSEREAVYAGLTDGCIDIVLTTPEYLSFHADRLAASGRIGFMVVDEAHHIGMAKAGQRMAYTQLGSVVSRLGGPVVLAVTATAPAEVAEDISDSIPVDGSVVDDCARDNLHVNDQRNIRNRDDYLAYLVAAGDKTVIYVNSREQSVGVARRLRRRVPQLAPMIGFYNAGLTRAERKRIEDLFRAGAVQVLVATSAFGEGIDIPDIRNVVLYHMPFNEVEFNQMAGRAGRDGKDAWIHLLYGSADVSINESILADLTPNRDVMAQVYRCLCALQKQATDGFLCISFEDLAREASNNICIVSPTAAACGISVFRELGLIETQETYNNGVTQHKIRVNIGAPKCELTDSVRYREGLDELSIFRAFRKWAMRSDLDHLSVRVTHPITPDMKREGR